ncbi:MAG: transposase [Eubacterium sp.]|nr:transposase [Eubacterium sp.]
MTRSLRIYCSSDIYHVVLRGNARMVIFQKEADYAIFKKQIYIFAKRYDANIYTYCLMSNHVHILLKCKNISEFMHDLAWTYTVIYNKRYSVEGHLYQGRFFSSPVESERYFLNALRYILHNPEEAGICPWETYKYSNAGEFLMLHPKETICFIAEMAGGVQELRNFLRQKDDADAALFYEPGTRRKKTDEEAMEIINRVIQQWNDTHRAYDNSSIIGNHPASENVSAGGQYSKSSQLITLVNLRTAEVSIRNAVLLKLLAQGIPARQLARLTGIGRRIIDSIAKKLKEVAK